MKLESEFSVKNGLLLTLGLSFVLNALLFQDLLFSPGKTLFGTFGDGLKNYYTVFYHAAYDTSAVHFQGMNYPHGEHVLFTDNQPLLGFVFQVLVQKFGMNPDLIPGILNLLMIAGILISSGFLWLIFAHFEVKNAFAILSAVLISHLSPQIDRMTAHYALSYACFIPGVVYFWLRTKKAEGFRSFFTLFFWGFTFTFLHLYYGLIFLVLLCGLVVSEVVLEKKRRISVLLTCGIAVLPLVLARIFLALTDSTLDRPESPLGFLYYRTRWEGVFLPPGQFPLSLFENLFPLRFIDWEGHAFAGFPVTFFSALFVFYLVRNRVQKQPHPIWKDFDAEQKAMSLVSIGSLLFAMGFPFIYGLEGLIPYLGPIQQFRSIGRFAWIFFYLANVLLVVYVVKKSRIVPHWVLLSVLMLWCFQIYDFRGKTSVLKGAENPFLQEGRFATEMRSLGIDTANFQAIWPVPYFHIGSEVQKLEPANGIIPTVIALSWVTGLPTTGVMLSRTSVSTSAESIGAHTNPDAMKAFLMRLPDKPLLLVLVQTEEALSPAEQWLLEKAQKIGSIKAPNSVDSALLYRFDRARL